MNCTDSLAKASIINGSVQGTGTGLNFTGYVKGVGVYTGTVTFSGTYSPGLSPASVQLENMNLTSSSVLNMEIGGLSAGGQHDQLNFSGNASLDGTLDVLLINGFSPSFGQSFDLFNGNMSGHFNSLSLPSLSPGLAWDESHLYTSGVLSVTAVPEPSTFVLGWLGLVEGIGLAARRRRTSPASRLAV